MAFPDSGPEAQLVTQVFGRSCLDHLGPRRRGDARRAKPGFGRAPPTCGPLMFVEVFGAPEEEEWAAPNFHLRQSLPRVIMDMLNIQATSKARVITTMNAVIDAHEAKRGVRPHRRQSKRGAAPRSGSRTTRPRPRWCTACWIAA